MTLDQNDSPRNIVICGDGTGNQAEGNLSNVMKLSRMAERTERQRVFYDPGVGTIGSDSVLGRLRQRIGAVVGLATGAALASTIEHHAVRTSPRTRCTWMDARIWLGQVVLRCVAIFIPAILMTSLAYFGVALSPGNR